MTTAVDSKLLEILVCPLTKGPLTYDREMNALISSIAGLAYPIVNGIPIMLIDEAKVVDNEKANKYRHMLSGILDPSTTLYQNLTSETP